MRETQFLVETTTGLAQFRRHQPGDDLMTNIVSAEVCSADRDEFDHARSPNPHIGFGGLGPHYCLGNQLAKAELRHLFRELLIRLRRSEFGEPAYLQYSFVHGIKRQPAFVQ
jgi:cytochrome P450